MKRVILLFSGLLVIHLSFSQTSLTFANLPLQITVNEGAASTYTFNASVTSVASRNPGVVSWSISGQSITFTAIKAGRTGLKIISGAQSYYIGMRINHSDGSMPGLPPYVSMGSVSEDNAGDIQFWEDIQPGARNKAMDIRYIYINGGPITGWHSWGAGRPGKFSRQSLKYGLIPFFVYYNIPDDYESYSTNLQHVQDPVYMAAYFNDLNMFMDSVENVMQGELYGIILEPDFLGYLQQNANPNDPLLIATAVGKTTIATNAGNIVTLVERINNTIQTKRNSGSNIFFGWQQNLWATAAFQGTQGIIRRTDDYTFAAAKYLIGYSSREATIYQIKAGALSHGADFISIDKYGLDAMGAQTTSDPSASSWFWNNDHWNNYLLYAQTIHETSGKPVILWQLPVGHINGSTYISAYTGIPYVDLSNTATKYEDSSTGFFFGDAITTNDPLRLNYFSENKWNDLKVTKSGNTISWSSHIQECNDAGIISAQFGAGVAASTDGVGSPPTDNYFWIQKVQGYYSSGTIPLNDVYAEGPLNPCAGGCPPQILFISPVANSIIYRSNLDSAKLTFAVWDNDGTITSLTATIDGSISLPVSLSATIQNLLWVPPTAWGYHTLTVSATDNNGFTTTQTITFSILYPNPTACGYPEWNTTTAYTAANTYVTYNGLIFKNKYWTQGDMPYLGGSGTPWLLEGVCPGPSVTTGIESLNIEESIVFYPNPTNGMVYFTVKNDAMAELVITDVSGRVLINKKTGEGINAIDMQNMAQGIYLIRIQLNDKVVYQKLIKQ